MSETVKLFVGQELYFVPSDSRNKPYWVTVNKIGSKWAQVSTTLRINIETLWADGGKYISPGRCWFSVEAHEAEVRRVGAWRELQKTVQYGGPPESLDENQILTMLRWVKPE